MQMTEFNNVIEAQIQRVRDVLCVKGEEYATEDRLHNFRTTATLQGGTLEQACGGFMAKHTVSVYDMIASGEEYPIEKWDEKITDHINYLFLLRAIVEERVSHKPSIDFDYGRTMDSFAQAAKCIIGRG